MLRLYSVPGFPLYNDTDLRRATAHKHYCFTIKVWFGANGNIYKLYIFLREVHNFLLCVLNGKATLWHELRKLYSFLAVDQKTTNAAVAAAKPCPRECVAVFWHATSGWQAPAEVSFGLHDF